MITLKQKIKPTKIRLATIVWSILIVLAVCIGLLSSLPYLPLSEKIANGKVTREIFARDPLPAAVVGKGWVSVSKLINETNSVKSFYENQNFSDLGLRVDFSTADGQKRLMIKEKEVLNKLIYDSVIEQEAKKRGIVLSQSAVNQEVDRKLKEYGTGDELKKNLQKLYGWTLSDFEKNIVEPDLYREKLSADIQKTDPSYPAASAKIQKADQELKNGVDFAAVARKYSDGDSAKDGGELGWFGIDQMVPAVALEVMKMKKGDVSEIIESSIGYHIVNVEDEKEQDGQTLFKIRQIFARTKSFSDWIGEEIKNYKIHIPMRGFRWDAKSGEVEFTSADMINYEKTVDKNPGNDPSMIF